MEDLAHNYILQISMLMTMNLIRINYFDCNYIKFNCTIIKKSSIISKKSLIFKFMYFFLFFCCRLKGLWGFEKSGRLVVSVAAAERYESGIDRGNQ